MKKNKKLKFFFFFLLLLILGANFVFTSEVSALEIDYPDLPGAESPQVFLKTAPPEEALSLYVKYILNLAVWAGGIIALGGLIYGGIRYLISTGKPEATISAKNQITAAFFGLLLLLSSYLVLSALNPELTILKISPLEEIEIIERRHVPPPSVAAVYSSIDVELPFARIIEKLFETYISEIPKEEPKEEESKEGEPPEEEKIPRMERIKNNVRAILAEEKKREKEPGIADKLKKQNEDLKDHTEGCECYENTLPDPRCWHGGCHDCPPEYCTCDPCKPVRKKIQNTEQDNLEQIDLLKEEQKKTIEEIKDLKIELKRLERVESFIKHCPFVFKNSYAQFLLVKKVYESEGGIVREIRFWDDINIFYLNRDEEIVPDWASFLCTIGGNILPSTRALYEEKETEEVEFEEKACSAEIPVGEIIDRTKRVAQLLINKLEILIERDKELIDAVDELQVLVSQCSSRRCEPECECHCDESGCWCVEIGCFGEPCPKEEIAKQVEEIQKIWREIKDVIEGKEKKKNGEKTPEEETPEEKIENIGIIPIIDLDDPNSVVSRILTELDKIQKLKAGIRGNRRPLQTCGAERSEETLLTCQRAKGKIDPEGRRIQTCCMDEPVFQECLEECYLEEGVEKYKICLQECLNRKSEEAKDKGVPKAEEITRCRHLLNFFCCVK